MCGVFRDLGVAHVVDDMGAPALLVLFGSGDWRLAGWEPSSGNVCASGASPAASAAGRPGLRSPNLGASSFGNFGPGLAGTPDARARLRALGRAM